MIFDVDFIIWHLSQYMALEPGDLVLTGTPEGVALSGRFPYLGPGDVVEVEIDGLGRQRQVMHAFEGALMPAEFDGLVAAVTGGASGIGAAIVSVLRERGARVAVLDLAPSDVPAGVLAVRTDVSDDASVRTAIDTVVAELGRLDILVNNAGIGAQGTVADNDDDEWMRVLDVNLLGLVRTSRAALPAPAEVTRSGDREHRLDRGHRRPSPAGAVHREQGRRARADPGDGRGPPA